MTPEQKFTGFQSPTSNTTYTPNQFFDVVLPNASRGVVRLVAYMIRKTLGWSDAHGNPQESQIRVSYRELETQAGIAQSKIRAALDEAIAAQFIRCLSTGHSHGPGVLGQSAVYELCWDERDMYVTDPAEFQGFYAGNGNLTYIPNEFFDVLIPSETLAVICVVGAIIRNTIGFQTRYGLRRQQIAMSFTELQRKTGIVSRRSLNDALKEALHCNYLQVVEAGYFDPQAGQNSRTASYGIRWQDAEATIAPASEQPTFRSDAASLAGNASKRIPGERLQKDTGGTPPKGYRERFQKDTGNASKRIPGERLQKDTDIEITQENKHINKQQQPAAAVSDLPAISLFQSLLTEEGFDEKTARYLVTSFPTERIERQRRWLAHRAIHRNRLGMLRRAIEQDWPQPEGSGMGSPVEEKATAQATQFAAHFYAGLAGNLGEPVAPPSVNDTRAATPYVARLLALCPEEAQIALWGREFGAFVQTSEQAAATKPIHSFVMALRAYGDAYYVDFCNRRRRQATQSQEAVKCQHETRFSAPYEAYLCESEQRLRQQHPDPYADFVQLEQKQRQSLEDGTLYKGNLLRLQLRVFNSPERHQERLREYFGDMAPDTVYDFWAWDTHLNPQRLEKTTRR